MKLTRYFFNVLLLLCACRVSGQVKSSWFRVIVDDEDIKHFRENNRVNDYSCAPFFMVLDHQYGNYAKDTLFINRPGYYTVETKITQPEILLIWSHGRVWAKYVLMPGREFSVRYEDINGTIHASSEEGGWYASRYRFFESEVERFWDNAHLNPSFIGKHSFAAYKLHIAAIREMGDSVLQLASHDRLFAPVLKRLAVYNRYKWAKAYIDFIRYKREADTTKTFDRVSDKDLEPVVKLMTETEVPIEYQKLHDEVTLFIERLRAVDYQTSLLFRSETHCIGYEPKWVLPDVSYQHHNLIGYGNVYPDFWAMKPVFEEAERFNERTGLAIVKYQGKFGVINTCFEYAVPTIYDHLSWVNDQLLICVKNGLHGVINTKNKEIIPPRFIMLSPLYNRGSRPETFYSEEARKYLGTFIYAIRTIPDDLEVGVVDTNDLIIIPAIYDGIGLHTSGCIWFFNQNKMNGNERTHGLIGTEGNIIIADGKHYIEQIWLNGEPFFLIKKEEGTKLVDRKGKQVYPHLLGEYFQEQRSHLFIFGSAKENVQQFHVFDRNGKDIIPEEVVDYRVYDQHVAAITRNKKVYLIHNSPSPSVVDVVDDIDSLTYYTYRIKKGKTIKVCDRNFNKLVALEAEELFVSDPALLLDTSVNGHRLYGLAALRKGQLYRVNLSSPAHPDISIRTAVEVILYRYNRKYLFTLDKNGIVRKSKQEEFIVEHDPEEHRYYIRSKTW